MDQRLHIATGALIYKLRRTHKLLASEPDITAVAELQKLASDLLVLLAQAQLQQSMPYSDVAFGDTPFPVVGPATYTRFTEDGVIFPGGWPSSPFSDSALPVPPAADSEVSVTDTGARYKVVKISLTGTDQSTMIYLDRPKSKEDIVDKLPLTDDDTWTVLDTWSRECDLHIGISNAAAFESAVGLAFYNQKLYRKLKLSLANTDKSVLIDFPMPMTFGAMYTRVGVPSGCCILGGDEDTLYVEHHNPETFAKFEEFNRPKYAIGTHSYAPVEPFATSNAE